MNLSPEEKEKLEEPAKAIAKTIHQNMSSDKLKSGIKQIIYLQSS
ncbi:hypothetical protein [Spirulina sp. 06S082]|nr:hypothetical protein [Spirulina sp. 06S082]MEA5471674.1 hypothetical protein [Spirulina sp. 06S082]